MWGLTQFALLLFVRHMLTIGFHFKPGRKCFDSIWTCCHPHFGSVAACWSFESCWMQIAFAIAIDPWSFEAFKWYGYSFLNYWDPLFHAKCSSMSNSVKLSPASKKYQFQASQQYVHCLRHDHFHQCCDHWLQHLVRWNQSELKQKTSVASKNSIHHYC